MGPRLFSGWGVRTLAEGEGRYNPIGYHVGTVWPFDNSFIAWGLRRYGFTRRGGPDRRRASSTRREFFDGRLPEAFAGYDRGRAPSTRSSTRPRAARRPGRPARRCCCCARCSGSSRIGEHLVIDPALPAELGSSRCSTSRAVGPLDAFGRGPAGAGGRGHQPAPQQLSAP